MRVSYADQSQGASTFNVVQSILFVVEQAISQGPATRESFAYCTQIVAVSFLERRKPRP